MTRPPKPAGGAMWWQRDPPEGWHYVRNVEHAVVMQREWSEAECDFTMDTRLFGLQRSKRGWCCSNHSDGTATLTLTGGGWGRPANARGQALANNGGDYTMRVEPGATGG